MGSSKKITLTKNYFVYDLILLLFRDNCQAHNVCTLYNINIKRLP